MTVNKTLGTIVLTTALGLGIVGCASRDGSMYHFDGKLNGEKITFEEKNSSVMADKFTLTVNKSDGRIITYVDNRKSDFKIEYVEITKRGTTTRYTSETKRGKAVLAEAQIQFDDYCSKIKAYNEKHLLDDIKK